MDLTSLMLQCTVVIQWRVSPFRNHSFACLWEFNLIVHERRKYLQLPFFQVINTYKLFVLIY
jgi:hypothetical protein